MFRDPPRIEASQSLWQGGLRMPRALRRGGSRSLLQRASRGGLRMPRPCAVEVHARGYKERLAGDCGCHGLAPWRFTFAATKNVPRGITDATALRRGASRSRLKMGPEGIAEGRGLLRGLRWGFSGERETPRRKAVASERFLRVVL